MGSMEIHYRARQRPNRMQKGQFLLKTAFIISENLWTSWSSIFKCRCITYSVKVLKALKTTKCLTIYSIHDKGIKSMFAELSSAIHVWYGLRVTINQVVK